MKKKLSSLLVLMLAFIGPLLFACGDDDATADGNTDSADGDLVIGYSINNLNEYNTELLAELEKHGEEEGVTVVHTVADGDANKQLTDVDSLIAQGVDVVVIKPQEQEGIQPAVDALEAAGIPVVMIDAKMGGYGYGYNFELDQGIHGRLMGEEVKRFLEENPDIEPKAGYLSGAYTENVTPRRTEIFAVATEVEEIAEADGGWNADTAMSITEDWLQAFPDMNMVFAMNDEMAIGAINALNGAGENLDEWFVGGVDGTINGQEYIKSGELDATTFVDASAYMEQVMEAALVLASGEEYTEEPDASIFKLLNPDNIDELIGE